MRGVRDYLPPGTPLPAPAPPPEPPRPGHGTVWLTESADDSWAASWQDGHRVADGPDGSREQAIAWAHRTPAEKRLIFSPEADDYLDLDDVADAGTSED
jgi:hypothetical protein